MFTVCSYPNAHHIWIFPTTWSIHKSWKVIIILVQYTTDLLVMNWEFRWSVRCMYYKQTLVLLHHIFSFVHQVDSVDPWYLELTSEIHEFQIQILTTEILILWTQIPYRLEGLRSIQPVQSIWFWWIIGVLRCRCIWGFEQVHMCVQSLHISDVKTFNWRNRGVSFPERLLRFPGNQLCHSLQWRLECPNRCQSSLFLQCEPLPL